MIRLASSSDIDKLVALGREFFIEAEYDKLFDYSPKDSTITYEALIDMNTLVVNEDEQGNINGMLGFSIFPLFLNRNKVLAQEMFWFVSKSVRKTSIGIDLLTESERIAKASGASEFMMLSLKGLNHDKMNNLYRSLGYSAKETIFMKGL